MRRSILFLMFVCAGTLFSQSQTEKKVYHAKHINPHPPTIDGRLDDIVWQKVEWQGDFTQRRPEDGAEPSQETQFKVLFDDKNLYVGIRAFDTEPDKISRRMTRRDDFDGDLVEINIDSYLDHRTAFSFTVNAAGVKGDEAISEDGDIWDANWNPVWYADVAIDSLGWTAEMKIPMSQLRFANQEEQVWGFQVMRHLHRKDERSHWQYIPHNTGGWVSSFGELRGIRGIKPSRRIELLPYAVSDLRNLPHDEGNPFTNGNKTHFSGGLDAKVGITSDMTMDLTINPDFGQVEADPSEVNLTAFETFFPEKRPFFIEGSEITRFKLMGGDGSFSNDQLFYSRRVGRSPQHFPDLANDEFSKRPDNTSIVGAFKLTGKTKNGLSIGVLNAVTEKESAQIDSLGVRSKETVEPLTNYFVGRVQQDYNHGNTSLGGMFTATNRNLSEQHLKFLNTAAYSGGIDFRHQWDDKTYYLDFKTSFSHIRGSEEAILGVQTASQHLFQRPDADYVDVDSSATSMSGHGGMFSIGRGGTSKWRVNAGAMWRSPGLEINDLGFMRTADRIMQWVWVGYRENAPFGIFRSFNLNFNQWSGWNFGRVSIFNGGNVNGWGQFNNYWSISGGIGRDFEELDQSATRGGPALRLPGWWTSWYNLSTDYRKPVQFGVGGNINRADDGGSLSNSIRGWVRLRPKDAMRIFIHPFYTFRKSDLQYIDTVVNQNSEDRFLFGEISQKTLGIVIRFDFSITPDLSLQYYGQPFVSAGTYSNFKRITNPRADNYSARFQTFAADELQFDSEANEFNLDEDANGVVDYSISNPDFNFRQFRSNLVMRWEYNPGSTLFLVWTQERTGSVDDGRFSFRNDLGDLFEKDATNVFLVKFSRWFSL